MSEPPAVLPNASADGPPPRRPVLTPIPRWVIVVGVPVMVLVAVATVWLLLGIGVTGDKLDAIRTGGTLGVGLGGVAVLWLAVRRQRSTELDLLQKYEAHRLAERVAAHSAEDAVERRITELYTKAVEQLGSEKAPVRLGGLYALERLAQNNTSQRQTIVNVTCAYLRMPYTPPDLQLSDNADTETRTVHEQRVQERQVRLTAQRLLTTHLRPDPDSDHPVETFWDGIDLDLTGATLINLDLRLCHIRTAQFTGATFTEIARFDHATFTGPAWFDHATFTGPAWFERATFTEIARFDQATFTEDARFDQATFTGISLYAGATFGGATFGGDARFAGATFTGSAWFDGATFGGDAQFTAGAWFDGATFKGGVPPEVARFAAEASPPAEAGAAPDH